MATDPVHILFTRLSLSEDEEALSELHDIYFYRLYRLAYSIVANKESAEEIASDVFLKIWEKEYEQVNNPVRQWFLSC